MNCSAKISATKAVKAPRYSQEEMFSIYDDGTRLKDFYCSVVHQAKYMMHLLGVPVYVFFWGDIDAGLLISKNLITICDFRTHKYINNWRNDDA